MRKEFKFKKGRLAFGVLFFSTMLIASIYFLIVPEKFIRNVFMTTEHIQILGILGILNFSTLLYSFLVILPRKYAIIISDDFLIDNSRYESLGKIKWTDISKIEIVKKTNIEISLKVDLYSIEKRNLLKRFLTFMNNWNNKKRILISSALTDSSIDALFEEITNAYRTNK